MAEAYPHFSAGLEAELAKASETQYCQPRPAYESEHTHGISWTSTGFAELATQLSGLSEPNGNHAQR